MRKLCLPSIYGIFGSEGTFKIIFSSILSKNHAPFLRNWSSSETRSANDSREQAALSSVGDFRSNAEQNNFVVFSIFCAVFQSSRVKKTCMSKRFSNSKQKICQKLLLKRLREHKPLDILSIGIYNSKLSWGHHVDWRQPLWAIALWKRPSAAGHLLKFNLMMKCTFFSPSFLVLYICSMYAKIVWTFFLTNVSTEKDPADSPKIVTFFESPPKFSIFSWTHFNDKIWSWIPKFPKTSSFCS